MRATLVKGAAFGAIVTVLTLASTAAFAGTGIGKIFDLGTTNRVNASTVLTGTTPGPQLRVDNASTGNSATGIAIHTDPHRPPLAVNSHVKVTNLNAGLLDGLHSAELQKRVSGACADGTTIASVDPTGKVSCGKSALFAFHHVIDTGTLANVFLPGLDLGLRCRSGDDFAGLVFADTDDADASLSWIFSEGGAASTVNASESVVPHGGVASFGVPGSRLEGQFVYSGFGHVDTISMHVIKGVARCEFSGTALVTATS